MLTKYQKINAYKFVRERLRSQRGSEFICIQLSQWLGGSPSQKELNAAFPELYACKPPALSEKHSWFDEHEEDLNRLLRIVLLDFLIKQLNLQI